MGPKSKLLKNLKKPLLKNRENLEEQLRNPANQEPPLVKNAVPENLAKNLENPRNLPRNLKNLPKNLENHVPLREALPRNLEKLENLRKVRNLEKPKNPENPRNHLKKLESRRNPLKNPKNVDPRLSEEAKELLKNPSKLFANN